MNTEAEMTTTLNNEQQKIKKSATTNNTLCCNLIVGHSHIFLRAFKLRKE